MVRNTYLLVLLVVFVTILFFHSSFFRFISKEPSYEKKLPLRLPEGFEEKFAAASLDVRKPYNALDDWLHPADKKKNPDIQSSTCFKSSFQTHIEKVSSYRQFTNNYKHAYPDTCSAPFKELTLNFYEPQAMSI